MAILELPIRSDLSAYTFQVQLESAIYQFEFRFNQRLNRWIMDIEDQNGVDVLIGIPMLTDADLIGRFVMDGRPPGKLLAYDESGQNQNATQFDFGNPISLLYDESTTVL